VLLLMIFSSLCTIVTMARSILLFWVFSSLCTIVTVIRSALKVSVVGVRIHNSAVNRYVQIIAVLASEHRQPHSGNSRYS
jgi:hypothetical protein